MYYHVLCLFLFFLILSKWLFYAMFLRLKTNRYLITNAKIYLDDCVGKNRLIIVWNHIIPRQSFQKFWRLLTTYEWAISALQTNRNPTKFGHLKQKSYKLVHRFDNRWRWCSGRFNFRQITLKVCNHKSLFSHVFFHSLCFEVFVHFWVYQKQTLISFSRNF